MDDYNMLKNRPDGSLSTIPQVHRILQLNLPDIHRPLYHRKPARQSWAGHGSNKNYRQAWTGDSWAWKTQGSAILVVYIVSDLSYTPCSHHIVNGQFLMPVFICIFLMYHVRVFLSDHVILFLSDRILLKYICFLFISLEPL